MNLKLIRGMTRPAITFILVLATALFLAFRVPMPDQWWALVAAAVGFWFISRVVEKKET